jgi:hypothetical protein
LSGCRDFCIFGFAKSKMVSWPSGLGTGLQNRLQRFESARDLKNPVKLGFFVHYNS